MAMLVAFYGLSLGEIKTMTAQEQDGFLACLPKIQAYRSWYRIQEARAAGGKSDEFMKSITGRVLASRPLDAIAAIQSFQE